MRVTAAAFDGRPIYFDIGAVQSHPPTPRASEDTRNVSRLTSDPTILFAFAAVALVSAVLLARRHLMRGQADRRGASRLGLYFFSLALISGVLWPDHVGHFAEEYFIIAKYVAWGLYWCAWGAVLYLAFEPSVRRRWPATLISWNRVLAGRLRDPIVGRDLLVGTVAGTAMVGITWLAYAAGTSLGSTTAPPFRPTLEAFREPRHVGALVIFLHAATLATALGFLFGLLSLRRLLRVRALALVAWMAMYAVIVFRTSISGFDWRIGLPAGLAGAAIAAWVLDRFGLVALCALMFTSDMLIRTPAALEFSAWYANRSLISLGIVVVIGLYGARTAVGGQGSAHRI
jgi:serine/threonine-protein kinase